MKFWKAAISGCHRLDRVPWFTYYMFVLAKIHVVRYGVCNLLVVTWLI